MPRLLRQESAITFSFPTLVALDWLDQRIELLSTVENLKALVRIADLSSKWERFQLDDDTPLFVQVESHSLEINKYYDVVQYLFWEKVVFSGPKCLLLSYFRVADKQEVTKQKRVYQY